MSHKRFQVFATRMNLTIYKQKLKAAERGHSLLKKKSDALTGRFRSILGDILDRKEHMGKMMQDASFSLTRAQNNAGDIGHTIIENVRQATFRVRLSQDNIAGVRLPSFTPSNQTEVLQQDLTGLAKGGQRVAAARSSYTTALESLVALASLQTAFITLDAVIRITNRRVNALQYVLIPKFEATIAYIESELDESDREEFFRLKKVQGNKRKQQALREAEREKRIAAGLEKASSSEPKSLITADVDEETDLFT